MPAVNPMSRLAQDGFHVDRQNVRDTFGAVIEWAKKYGVPSDVAYEAWAVVRDYYIPPKDRQAMMSFHERLVGKFKAEEDVDFEHVPEEMITPANIAVAINENPNDSLVTRKLRKFATVSLKLNHHDAEETPDHFTRRITNQNKKPPEEE